MRSKRGIFARLIGSFLIFTVLSIVIFIGCLFTVAYGIGGRDTSSFNVYGIVNESGEVMNITAIQRLGGWVEKLDDDYHVIQIWGEKQNHQQVYSKKEFTQLTQWEDKSLKYLGFVRYRQENGQDFYYLTIMPRKIIKTDITFLINGIPVWNVVFIILGFGLFALLCIGMSYYLSSTIKKPLKKLTDGMERVRQGEEGVRLVFDTKAEFAQIKDIFNLMMERLEKEKAEKLCNERKKNQLLLDLSHDIKTPISTIKSYANALQANLVPEEEKEKVYAMIDVKANRVSSLMEDMFLMLKLDRLEYAVEKEALDLCELLREICAEYYDEITDRGYDFEIQIPEERVEVNVDAKLFTRVIGNLLTNAVKYNQTGHYIGITCSLNARIEVLDDGAPIPERLQKSLFDAFVRGDEARTSVGGTGLGLSIAKTIISRHGGRIEYLRKGEYNCFLIQM